MLGFAFLYAPIVSLVIFSFNKSKLVTVWGGFSTKWYGELFRDPQILGAAWLSLQIAFASADPGHFGRPLLGALPPLSGQDRAQRHGDGTAGDARGDPGLSLLLFVAMEAAFGWPSGARDMDTIIIAHATFCMAYVAVVMQARLVDMDESLDEAAQDLGATPLRVFFDVTLPVISPALISAGFCALSYRWTTW